MNSYSIFIEQLNEVCKYYPNLYIVTKDGKSFLKGIIDIHNSEGNVVNNFLIEIHYTTQFPYRFPRLYEVGGSIPREADWHINRDNSCCITVEPQEVIYCKDGITVNQFLRNHAIPYLSNQAYKILTGYYKAEYSHGIEGLKEFYSELMKTSDINKWHLYTKYAFDEIKFKRNGMCFCGSKIKFKRCHAKIFEKIRIIGYENLNLLFEILS